MKNVIAGFLKKANNKESKIEVVDGVAVESIYAGKFKPSKGEFFDELSDLIGGEAIQNVQIGENLVATFETVPGSENLRTLKVTSTIECNDGDEYDGNPCEADDQMVVTEADFEEGANAEDPESATSPCEELPPLVSKKDVLVVVMEPHIKKDGTFTQLDDAVIYVNLAQVSTGKFKSKAVVTLIG